MHSIGLNWLRRINRHLPTPRLIIAQHAENSQAGGFYLPPWKEECVAFGVTIPASKNGTVVCFNFDDTEWDHGAVIAHEWRHHYQYWRGQKYVIVPTRKTVESYEKGIVRYFTTSWTEYDALRFECAVAPSPENQWRMAAVCEYRKSGRLLEWG